MKTLLTTSKMRRMIVAMVTMVIIAFSCASSYAVQQPSKVSTNHPFYGIDVSLWQGNINWKKVKRAGADYAFIRAGATKQDSFSFVKDSKFEQNMSGAQKAGVARGVYWYSQATSTEEAVAEAKEVCKYVEGYNLELPVVMDLEFSNGRLDSAYAQWVSAGGSSNASEQMTKIAEAFLDYCEEHGHTSCLYVSKSLAQKTSGVDVSQLTKDGHELWIAQYNDSNTSSSDYTYWQYSSVDHISGISGRVDSNYMYIPKNKDANGNVKLEATMEYSQVAYTGSAVKPTITVKDGVNELTENEDYTIIYARNVKKGTAYAIIKGKGDYRGYTECVPFTIGKENVKKADKADKVTSVVTTEVNGNTKVKFAGARSNAGNYRVYYRSSDSEKWQSVDTNKQEVILQGTPSQVKVSTIRDNKVVATTTPTEKKTSEIIDKTVKEDTQVTSTQKEKSDLVRLIDKEVSSDVSTSSGKN